MFLTVHSTAAIAITKSLSVSNPLGAFFIGLVSHYILDAIPHGDESFKNLKIKEMGKIALLDQMGVFVVLALLYLFKPDFIFSFNLIMAVIGALLPDWTMVADELSKKYLPAVNRFFYYPYQLHKYCHGFFKRQISFSAGFFLQAVFLAIFWALI